MKSVRSIALLTASHIFVAAVGFAAGIYALPILTAPEAPSAEQVANKSKSVMFETEFTRALAGSDFLHWGEGKVTINSEYVTLRGSLAPGPNYKLYFSPEFVETEAEFQAVKDKMVAVGDINTFENFIVELPSGFDFSQYNSIIVWCESFNEFITAAKFK